MSVKVVVPTVLRRYSGGQRTVEATGDTIAEVIDDLESRYRGISGRLVTEGALNRFVNIYIDDDDVRYAGGLQAPVTENATIMILPAVAGG
ncbi:MoaD/ThiS family protein [Kutzneria sp. CA-103260]|uniref:MoaD/ThiS family protein n=1 Tax=Kutzneria sp. CA-103260 TaxID=2802641 RepID=UPI001BAA2CF5|nr:MoaD/ThiS family protein [Kutzneria sp. CA-103260]QUQ64348.1 ThiS/MoaD family protein [Kutzneria sp. CA-103260]